jgi:hypothetical protein
LSSQPIESQLRTALARLGFQARASNGRLEMSRCPCPLLAPEHPELVCAMADAVVDGTLEGSELVAGARDHDTRARCCSANLCPA